MSKRVFAFNYVLRNKQGETLDSSDPGQPLPFLEGSQQIIPALEEAIVGMQEGDKKKVALTADKAYGIPQENMVMDVPRPELAHIPELAVGAFLRLELDKQTKVVRVTHLDDQIVKLDGNHPLAGVDLEFDIEMVLIRPATLEETVHGHPHGLHGNTGH
ncbi:MAG: peptidylprolyl isomerase [Bdellovibrionota bacterium]